MCGSVPSIYKHVQTRSWFSHYMFALLAGGRFASTRKKSGALRVLCVCPSSTHITYKSKHSHTRIDTDQRLKSDAEHFSNRRIWVQLSIYCHRRTIPEKIRVYTNTHVCPPNALRRSHWSFRGVRATAPKNDARKRTHTHDTHNKRYI